MVPEARHEGFPILNCTLHVEIVHVRPYAARSMSCNSGLAESIDCVAETQGKAWGRLATTLNKTIMN